MKIARLALAACALSCSVASAHSNGTVFSSPVDGDSPSIFWNPAAMSLSTTSRFDLVANFQIVQASYQRDGVDSQQGGRPYPRVSFVTTRPEPSLGLILDKLWHRRLRLGINITLPDVSGAAWPYHVDDGGQEVLGPTRYYVNSAQIFTGYAQLGASIAVHRTLAIGATVNIDFTSIDARKDVDLANQPPIRALPCAQNPLGCENPNLSAPIHLHGAGVSAGASVGVLWMPIDRLRIGAAYLSPVHVAAPLHVSIDSTKLSDFAKQFLPGFGTIPINGSGTIHLTIPQRVHFGIAGDVTRSVELMAMFVWQNDSAAELIGGTVTTKSSSLVPSSIVIPSVKNDTYTVIARIVGKVRDRAVIGFSTEFTSSGVPTDYLSPLDLDFNTLTFNLGARGKVYRALWLGGSLSQTVVFSRSNSKSVYANDGPVPYNTPDPSGKYRGNAERVGLDVSYAF